MWQLKTNPIKTSKEDQLSYNVIAELLAKKLKYLFEKKDIPSSICLNGDYGSGKSTIINFLIEKMNGKANIKLILFNAGRHKNKNIHYELFRNIFYTLNNKKGKDFRDSNFLDDLSKTEELEELDQEFSKLVYESVSTKEYNSEKKSDEINDFISKDRKKSFPVKIKFIGKILLWISLIGIVLVLGTNLRLTKDIISSFQYSLITFILLIFSSTLIASIAKENIKLIPKLIELKKKNNEKKILFPNINNADHLQTLYRKILNKHSNKNYNYIVIIEDIDRKHYDEMISSLNDLRIFIDLGKAIFLIPCGLKNIEQAFKETVVDKGGTNMKEVVWKAKDFCNKIFSHIVTIPSHDKQDLRILLQNRINLEWNDHPIKKYLKENKLDDLVDILIVDSIKTPREAINMFNRFTLQFEYSLKLEEEGKRLKLGTISNNILQYARIYVLSNYYNLEKELLENPDFLKWIVYKFKNNENMIPKYAKNYLENLYNQRMITKEIEGFVNRTQKYDSNLIKPFIYLEETSYSGVLGNEFYLQIFKLLKDRETDNLIEKISLNKVEVSEIIDKIIDNLSYTSQYKSIVLSLIDVNLLLEDKYIKKISAFIAKHLDDIDLKTLSQYNPKTIFGISENLHDNEKEKFRNTYLEILNKDNLSEYANEEKIFKICFEVIKKIKSNKKFASSKTIFNIKNIIKLPLNNLKKEKILCLKLVEEIDGLDPELTKDILDVKILERIINNIDKNNFDLSTRVIKKISSYYLNNNESDKVLEMLKKLSKSDDKHQLELYLSIIEEYIEFFPLQTSKEKILDAIFTNILQEYFTEEKYIHFKETIINSVKMVAKLDGELFRIERRNQKVFKGLKEIYIKNIGTTKDAIFLEFNLKIINLHEKIAGYIFNEDLISVFLDQIKFDLTKTMDENEFKFYMLIANHFSLKDRIINLKEENSNQFRDIIMNDLSDLVNKDKANTEQSNYIYEFLKTLTKSLNFNEILGNWISEKNILPKIKNDLNYYRDLFKIYELSEENFSDTYVNNLYDNLYYNVSNYPNRLDLSLKSWEWLYRLSKNYSDSSKLVQITDYIFDNYTNLEKYSEDKIKLYIVKILDKFAPFDTENKNNKFINLLLWGIKNYPELDLILIKRWDLLDDIHIKETLTTFEKNNLLKNLKNVINNNQNKMEEIIANIIIGDVGIHFIKNIHKNFYNQLNWNNINKKILQLISKKMLINKIEMLDEISDILKISNNILDVEDIVNPYLIKLFEENYSIKIMGLNLIDNLNLRIKDKSDVYFSIINNYVEKIDKETEFEVVEQLVKWLISQDLYKISGIEMKLIEIKNLVERELQLKYESLIKYGK